MRQQLEKIKRGIDNKFQKNNQEGEEFRDHSPNKYCKVKKDQKNEENKNSPNITQSAEITVGKFNNLFELLGIAPCSKEEIERLKEQKLMEKEAIEEEARKLAAEKKEMEKKAEDEKKKEIEAKKKRTNEVVKRGGKADKKAYSTEASGQNTNSNNSVASLIKKNKGGNNVLEIPQPELEEIKEEKENSKSQPASSNKDKKEEKEEKEMPFTSNFAAEVNSKPSNFNRDELFACQKPQVEESQAPKEEPSEIPLENLKASEAPRMENKNKAAKNRSFPMSVLGKKHDRSITVRDFNGWKKRNIIQQKAEKSSKAKMSFKCEEVKVNGKLIYKTRLRKMGEMAKDQKTTRMEAISEMEKLVVEKAMKAKSEKWGKAMKLTRKRKLSKYWEVYKPIFSDNQMALKKKEEDALRSKWLLAQDKIANKKEQLAKFTHLCSVRNDLNIKRCEGEWTQAQRDFEKINREFSEFSHDLKYKGLVKFNPERHLKKPQEKEESKCVKITGENLHIRVALPALNVSSLEQLIRLTN